MEVWGEVLAPVKSVGVLPLISKGAESGSSRGRTMRRIDRVHSPLVCPAVPDFRKSHGPLSGRLKAPSNMTFLGSMNIT